MVYDAIVIGAGPAGLTAALYLLRDGKKVLLLEKESIGGAIASSPLVENYPGYKAISGSDLTSIMYDQIEDLGVDIELEEVKKINIKKNDVKEVVTDDNKYQGKVVIVATGSKYRTLGLPNEEELIGHGIHFCVACDGAFYKDKDIAINLVTKVDKVGVTLQQKQRNLILEELDLVVGDDFELFSSITKAGKKQIYDKIERTK